MDQSTGIPKEYQPADPSANQSYTNMSQGSTNIATFSENLGVNVVNPLKGNSNVSSTSSLQDMQSPSQISLVNFHQHFHTSSGSAGDGSTSHGHSYLPIVRNKIVNSAPISTTVPEFLYQLTKMLTDNNKEVIEWANGKIDVHNPHKLASDVLHKYFRHSKYASFQRQLNYFGFRKLAGKGKMSPCSYINDAATMDIRSLLTIKRKTTGSSANEKNAANKKRKIDDKLSAQAKYSLNRSQIHANLPLSGSFDPSKNAYTTAKPGGGIGMIQKPISTSAKVAIGKGVKHFLNGFQKMGKVQLNVNHINDPLSESHKHHQQKVVPPPIISMNENTTSKQPNTYTQTSLLNTEDNRPMVKEFTAKCINRINLSVLEKNYKNSLQSSNNSVTATESSAQSPMLVSCGNSNETLNNVDKMENFPGVSNTSFDTSRIGSLQADSSLVDLAYIPTLGSSFIEPFVDDGGDTMAFIDFPQEIDNPPKTSD